MGRKPSKVNSNDREETGNMNVLWLINIRLPRIDSILGKTTSAFGGGWISGLSDKLLEKKDIRLIVCYPNFDGRKEEKENHNEKFRFYGINVNRVDFEKGRLDLEKYKEVFDTIIGKEKPDVIHIHGTEFQLALALTNSAEKSGYLDKVVVSIQGLVSIYAQHYFADLPEKMKYRKTLYEWLKKTSMMDDYKKYVIRGIYEIKILEKVKNVIGRTAWDKACAKLTNHEVRYFECNEILRTSFYSKKWSFDDCEKHTVFLSQGAKPIKGLHKVIEAATYIKKQFPDLKIYVAGAKLIGEEIKVTSSYARYVRRLIKENGLEDNIEFLGNLNPNQMCDALLRAHVFVCPSSIENSPNSLGEAMLLGVPCIASDVGGVSSMLEHRKEGILYPFSEAYSMAYYIMELFENVEETKKYSNNARIRAKKVHDPIDNAIRTIDIYKSLQ